MLSLYELRILLVKHCTHDIDYANRGLLLLDFAKVQPHFKHPKLGGFAMMKCPRVKIPGRSSQLQKGFDSHSTQGKKSSYGTEAMSQAVTEMPNQKNPVSIVLLEAALMGYIPCGMWR